MGRNIVTQITTWRHMWRCSSTSKRMNVGCEIKTYDEMCAWAHYDPGVAKGGSFKGFICSCCWYSPTETQWRADLASFHRMTDERSRRKRGRRILMRAMSCAHTSSTITRSSSCPLSLSMVWSAVGWTTST